MKVAIIYNKDLTGVINKFGMQNKERYNPKTVRLVSEALILQRDLVSPGWDVVVIARMRVRQADYWAVERSVTHLLSMGKLYGEERPRGSVSTGTA